MSETWRVARGSGLRRVVTFRGEDGAAVPYAGSEPLGGTVWAGRDDAPLLALAPTWSDPALGRCAVVLAGADTLPLTAGLYRLVLTVAGDDAFEAAVEITWAPGSSVAPRVYCTYADLLQVAPWVAVVADPETDEAGFLRQRVRAREELDDAIIANYRGDSVGQFGLASMAALGWAGGGPRRMTRTSYLIRGYLNAGRLMGPNEVNPIADRPQTARVCAYRAAALVGIAQLGRNNAHATFGALCQSLYERELAGYTAELDINADGYAEIAIKLGSTNPLFT